MSRITILCIAAATALLLVACDTANVGTLSMPSPDKDGSFALTTDPGTGTFTPEMVVEETATGAEVLVYARNAEELGAAYLHVEYDISRYTPVSVAIGDFLGSEDETISLALLDVAGEVPIGVTQVAGHVSPRDGEGLLAQLEFIAKPYVPTRSASNAPTGTHNAVNDLTLAIVSDSAFLSWTELNVGDYDNNGEVNIGDLTPLGAQFGVQIVTANDPAWASLIDGDKNGELNIADLQPIGANYRNFIAGYFIYVDAEGTDCCDIFADRDDHLTDPKRRVQYEVNVPLAQVSSPNFTVRPASTDADPTTNIGPVSNNQPFVNEPGAPTAPTTLAADAGEGVGHGVIALSWAKSSSPDVLRYEIESKLSSEGDGSYVMLTDVSGGSTSYSNNGLDEVSYDYRVRAKDVEGLYSDYSNIATQTPWFAPKPTAPSGVSAVPHPSQSLSVNVHWDYETNMLAKFHVYRSVGDDLNFSKLAGPLSFNVRDLADSGTSGLTEGVEYYYYVTVELDSIESDPSAMVSSQCSVEQADEINITNIQTNKKTQYANGGDADASVVTVSTDLAPDTVSWTANGTPLAGETGLTLNWKPAAGSTVETVVLACTVNKGAANDTDSVEIYLCENPITVCGGGEWSGGTRDHAYLDESFADIMEPLSMGGNVLTSGVHSDYGDGDHVVLLNYWFQG